MRQVFKAKANEESFREHGYVVVDLLGEEAVGDLWSFYTETFQTKRPVVPYARQLPYYISIFDADSAYKRRVDEQISGYVVQEIPSWLADYEVFYSNFMIKFPGDGQIEAHQDFNFVDESQHTAFNLWCPLVDTGLQNGGLFVIPGSHQVFRTQRGPNLPKALTEYNDTLKKYGRLIPLRKGQAIIFDHKLVHYSPPNRTGEVRVAVQSVLTPREAPAVHYVFDAPTAKVRAYRIDKEFILTNDLWATDISRRELDHEEDLIPFPAADEVTRKLAGLIAGSRRAGGLGSRRPVFVDEGAQEAFDRDGLIKLSVLDEDDVRQLTALFVESTGGQVANSAYGMYISLEDSALAHKRALIRKVSGIILPKVREHFRDCKPHLGSFLVKAPGADSYTYPHQDWTFVDPPNVSVTVWVALVDTDESNGALGFVKGSQSFFDKLVGSPSPDFRTSTQGHEAILYQYLQFVPLKAGEAVAFDNRTIHGATPNLTNAPRTAVAIGMTPQEAPLYHYFLMPGSSPNGWRKILKLKVDENFFEQYGVASLKALFDRNETPPETAVEAVVEDEFIAFSGDEIRQLCEGAGLVKNGRQLTRGNASSGGHTPAKIANRLGSAIGRAFRMFAGS
jgi:ectoine hydroxylase-related dioxygenase (phytanoyl-CoA dioxygenase family)